MLTLILKSLNICNLRCAYCSVGDKTIGKKLSPEQMIQAVDFFARMAIGKQEKDLQIIFHGGEPTLLPAKQYEDTILFLKENYPQLSIRFSMQTNGLEISDAYLDLFKKHEISVGVSIDGSEMIQNQQRRTVQGKDTYQTVWNNIQRLQAHGIAVSGLMVLTKPAAQNDLTFLHEFAQIDLALKINPLIQMGAACSHQELYLQPGEYGTYLTRVFEYILAENIDVTLDPLMEGLEAVLNQSRPHGCIFQTECFEHFICIDPEGGIYPCGHFADEHSHCLGSIWKGITTDPRPMLKEQAMKDPVCTSCEILSYCNRGCPANRADGQIRMLCEDYKILFRFLSTKGLALYETYLMQEQEKLIEQLKQYEESHAI